MQRSSRRDLLRWMAAGAASSFVPVAYADWATGSIQVERHTLRLPRWQADGFRVVFLADLHANTWERVEVSERAISMALAEKPDVLLLGGDYLNYWNHLTHEILQHVVSLFEPATCPVFTVFGNHDYWSGQIPKIKRVFDDSPVRYLQNQAQSVGPVLIAGVDDALMDKHDPRFLDEYRDAPSILTLLHEPDFVDVLPSHVSLMLAGHSHGGQVCLPGGVPLHTPRGAWKYIAGFYPDAKVPLYVTRGVGTTGPNWRAFCRPEVTVLTIYERRTPS